jgi:hypothetical protein
MDDNTALRAWLFRDRDPGPCPICGTPHTACTGPSDRPVATARVPWKGRRLLVVVPRATPAPAAPAPDDDSPAA